MSSAAGSSKLKEQDQFKEPDQKEKDKNLEMYHNGDPNGRFLPIAKNTTHWPPAVPNDWVILHNARGHRKKYLSPTGWCFDKLETTLRYLQYLEELNAKNQNQEGEGEGEGEEDKEEEEEEEEEKSKEVIESEQAYYDMENAFNGVFVSSRKLADEHSVFINKAFEEQTSLWK